ncbi:histidine kinase dimerization/phospho-acceptor domain-containing protein, partial [Arthrospira platensis SPKY1]|nr:histidine kinase dimerization/phospho-acceptor domain-containing protein [Arthrospira platensis SPKY1]
ELLKANELLQLEVETRKIAEKKSEKARRSAEDAMKSKSEFMSRMSHELRTPLNSILGFAQLLEMGELNEKQKRAVSHILTDGKKLLQLINEVLDITNIESGRLSLSMEAVQVYPALK